MEKMSRAMKLGETMLERISEHVWIMPKDDETDRPALGYVNGGKTSMMVDTGNSPDHLSVFYGVVRSMGMPDPGFVVLTHHHWDHVFGLAGSPAKSIAHLLTNEKLQIMHRWDWSDAALSARVAAGMEIPFSAEMIKKEMPIRHSFKVRPADISFEVECHVRLDEIPCQLLHVGGPHCDDSIVVYLPEESVLFLGDCYHHDLYNHNALKLADFQSVLNRLETIDAKWFIPSHENPIDKQKFISQLKDIEKIGLIIGDLTDEKMVRERLEKKLKRAPTAEELEYGVYFTAGNQYPERRPLE